MKFIIKLLHIARICFYSEKNKKKNKTFSSFNLLLFASSVDGDDFDFGLLYLHLHFLFDEN